ncbi:LLM class F420-dependent oxidoreductase [Saccharomonospora sp. NPDC006951]
MDFRILTEPQQGASYDDLLRIARTAEAAGFDGFFRSDHFLRIGKGSALPGPTDSWTTLAGLARDTSRIRLGTLVTAATFRNPVILAISTAQVDLMSGGRVELGIGAGWYSKEHQALGISFPPTSIRFEILTEQLEIITDLWRTPIGSTYNFSGNHYRVQNAPTLPKPQQEPRPPIIIGGRGKKRTPRIAARFANEFNQIFAEAEPAAQQFDRVMQAAKEAGRSPGEIVRSAAHIVCTGRNRAELDRRYSRMLEGFAPIPPFILLGSPAQLVDEIERYRETTSLDRLYFELLDLEDPDHIELIADQVVPQLGSRPSDSAISQRD